MVIQFSGCYQNSEFQKHNCSVSQPCKTWIGNPLWHKRPWKRQVTWDSLESRENDFSAIRVTSRERNQNLIPASELAWGFFMYGGR